jgi:hypothetical protein
MKLDFDSVIEWPGRGLITVAEVLAQRRRETGEPVALNLYPRDSGPHTLLETWPIIPSDC